MTEEVRQTGRTSRMLLDARFRVLRGETVIVVGADQRQAYSLKQMYEYIFGWISPLDESIKFVSRQEW
jgi:hypothetical protein